MRYEWQCNRGYFKSQTVVTLFRFAQYLRNGPSIISKTIYPPFYVFYKIVVEWVIGIELPPSTRVGRGLRIRHGIGIVVNPRAIIGEDVTIRQNVTIGNRHRDDDCPKIGNNVELGAGAILIGAITVGSNAKIGAGAVVVFDVPESGVTIPARAKLKVSGHDK
ncbi:serine acetyltransferase [Rhodococcus sp. T2V]|uniref:serine acetyltransferase n=1 Tax=Rhodococcus sp. T2V TaxID=3034164 RepID=UPI0023E226B8|nr:serine acetyltransferase [Rhodococcus sp. T2V]MDF3303402.1 serine acetyltransferase [Rhodococcus sp. T2V]